MHPNQDYVLYIEALGMISRYRNGDCCDLIAMESGANISLVRLLISAFIGGHINVSRLREFPGHIFQV